MDISNPEQVQKEEMVINEDGNQNSKLVRSNSSESRSNSSESRSNSSESRSNSSESRNNSSESRSNSSESDNDEAGIENIAKNIETLDVKEFIPIRQQAKDLIQKLIQEFTEYDTTFLKEYLDVLQNNPSAVKDVTNNIVFSIEGVLKQQLRSNQQWQENVLVVLLAWMCVTVLCLEDPQVQSPYRALSELLLYTTMRARVRLASAFWRHLNPALLIELADVTTKPKPQPRPEVPAEPEASLADLLLRAALGSLQPERHEPQWQGGPLQLEEVAAGLTNAWPAADVDVRSLLVQVAARTHSVRTLFDVAKGTHEDGRSETIKVMVEMSKVHLLFLDDVKIPVRHMNKSNKRKRKED